MQSSELRSLTSRSGDVRPLQTAAAALLLRLDADVAPVGVGPGGVETLQDEGGVLLQLGDLGVQLVQICPDGLHLVPVVVLDLVCLTEGETAEEEADGEDELHLSTQPPALEVC